MKPTEEYFPIRNLLPQSELTCFVVSGLFSEQECEHLLSTKIRASFQKANLNYPTYYRNNDRQIVDSTELSEQLFNKVKPYLPESVSINSSISAENGDWNLIGLNNRLRFCRYRANQYFHRHLDGIHYQDAQTQSKLTFMVYLNDASEFEGGKTLFYQTKNSEEVWATYIPQQGDLIVFDHNVWHEGEILKSGQKFILRSDILYSKAPESSKMLPFNGHLGYIWALLKLDSNTILSGGRDKIINIWNQKGQLQKSLKGHQSSILCLEKMAKNIFLTGSRDQKILVWERAGEEFTQRNRLSIHSAVILSICKLTESLFASAGGDKNIQICSLNGELVRTLTGHSDWVWQLILVNDDWLISCSEDASIKIWNWETGELVQNFQEEFPIFCLAYQTESRQLISANLKGEITIRRFSDGLEVIRTTTFQGHQGIIRSIKFINTSLFATGGEDNKIRTWHIQTLRCMATFEHQNFVQALEVLDRKLLSASYDGTIQTWDFKKKESECR